MSGVHRLAPVFQLLLDIRSLELKRENEDVKDGLHVWRRDRPSTMSWFDRLALVSKAFMDTAFLDLKREHESVKLELFWQTYSAEKLNREIDSTCRCVECLNTGRYLHEVHEDAPEWTGPCAYWPWFQDFMENNELEVVGGRDAKDDHVHFNILDNLSGCYWVYGSRFT